MGSRSSECALKVEVGPCGSAQTANLEPFNNANDRTQLSQFHLLCRDRHGLVGYIAGRRLGVWAAEIRVVTNNAV
jgi:hypothetical protein